GRISRVDQTRRSRNADGVGSDSPRAHRRRGVIQPAARRAGLEDRGYAPRRPQRGLALTAPGPQAPTFSKRQTPRAGAQHLFALFSFPPSRCFGGGAVPCRPLIFSPVCGFRPSRAGRAATLKVLRPVTRKAVASRRLPEW